MIKTKYNLDPAKYDFIFKVNNFIYFFFYFVFKSKYSEYDFIFTNKGKEWKAYLSKKDRIKTSQYGLRLMQNQKYFDKYEKKVISAIKKSKLFLSSFAAKDFSNFSNNDLARQIRKIAKFVINLWSVYLPTEYFYYDEVEKKENSSKRISKNIKRMQKIKYNLREEINKTIFGRHIFSQILKEVAKRTKIKESELDQMSHSEIIDLLEGKKYKKTDRKEYIIGQFSIWNLIVGKEARAFIEILENYHAQKISNVLTGQIGNKGRYTGRVKIINLDLKLDHIKEISKMKKGDVLVSGSTGPEMILACRKAGAIVTEEGGITSHAAIVSRELGIPAVIGTKIATEVLHDGDLVEVDADHGIVKIIKNKNRK